MKNLLPALLILAAGQFVPAAVAQEQAPPASPQLVDRIVAIVDEEAILLSDLEREIESFRFEMQSSGQPITEDDGAVRARMLEQLIEVKLLVAQAKLDGLVIGEDELDAETAQALQRLIDRFGTRKALDRELAANNMTYEDLEASNREIVRNRLYTMRMIQSHIRPRVEVLEEDIKAFYEEHRAEIPGKPAMVQLATILVVPQPDAEVLAAIDAKMTSIEADFVAGKAFEDIAKEFSDGPNASRGGFVGRFGRGDLFSPALETAAWEIEEGMISQPITTPLGIHVIRVTNRDESGLDFHQIMLNVAITDENQASAKAKAESVVVAARSGQDWSELVRTYSDDPETREKGGMLEPVALDRLSPTFQQAITPLAAGEVSEPIEADSGYFVVKLLERIEGSEFEFEEIKERLRGAVWDQKIQDELDVFTKELREAFYVDIRS